MQVMTLKLTAPVEKSPDEVPITDELSSWLAKPEVKTLCENVQAAGSALQDIQDFAQLDEHPIARQIGKVRFPRGYLQTADAHRKTLPFVDDAALKSNLAYTLILANTGRWLVERTDIWGVPRDMLIKLQIFLYGTLVESITKDFLQGICGDSYKRRTARLRDLEIIDDALCRELDWIWDERNKMHLFQLEEGEYENKYNPENQARCITAFDRLLESLGRHGRLRTEQ